MKISALPLSFIAIRLDRRDLAVVGLGIAFAVFVYLPNLADNFLGIDQEDYAMVIASGDFFQITLDLLTDFRGCLVRGYYAPLSSVTLMLDKWLVGSATPVPIATHAVNLFIHCLDGFCVFLLSKMLGAGRLTAGFGAFLFLLHPVQVSSILWFAGRKTLLSTFFFLASLVAYLDGRKRASRNFLGLSLALFILAILAKPTALALPALLLISELLLPLPPFEMNYVGTKSVVSKQTKTFFGFVRHAVSLITPLVRTLAPFVGIALLVVVVAVLTEPSARQAPTPWWERGVTMILVYSFYLGHVLFPFDIMYVYPCWDSYPLEVFLGGVCLFAVVSVATLVLLRHKNLPMVPLWGMAVFVLCLLPASGFVHFGWLNFAPVADHFVYCALVGVCITVAHLVTKGMLQIRTDMGRWIGCGLIALIAVGLVYLTWIYAAVWRSDRSLWTHNVTRCPGCAVPEYELGRTLYRAGQIADALIHFHRAVQAAPNQAPPYYGLGLVYDQLGDTDRSLEHYRRAIALRPTSPFFHRALAIALLKKGLKDDAITALEDALRLGPYYENAAADLGALLLSVGRFAQAAEVYGRAIALSNNNPEYRNGCGVALAELGRTAEAVSYFKEALRLDPNHVGARRNLESLGVTEGGHF